MTGRILASTVLTGCATLFWCLAGPTGSAQTETPAPAESKPITALIEQLAADDFATRKQAYSKLMEHGVLAIPTLKRAAQETDDPEVRHLTGKLIEDITVADRDLATLITLKTEDEPLKEVIEQLKRQIDGPFSLNQRPKDARLTLDVTREPLWNVLREIHRQTGCGFSQRASTDLHIDGKSELVDPDAPSAQQGPFLIVSSGARRERTINYGAEEGARNSLSLGLHVFIEPKVRLVPDQHYLVIEEATDGQGRDITKELVDNHLDWKTNSHGGRHCSYAIPIPESDGRLKKIGTLRGHVPILVETEAQKISVPKLLDAKRSRHLSDDWSILIEEVTWKGGTCSVELEATYLSPKDAPEWRGKMQFHRHDVFAKDGTKMKPSGYSTGSGGRKFHGRIRYRPAVEKKGAEPSPPHRLVYTYTSKRVVIKVPFEFKDLPLP